MVFSSIVFIQSAERAENRQESQENGYAEGRENNEFAGREETAGQGGPIPRFSVAWTYSLDKAGVPSKLE
jgi:hypothetical protein